MQHVDRVLEMADGVLLPEGEGVLVAQHRRPIERAGEAPMPRLNVPPARPPRR